MLSGNIARDPEVRYTNSGKTYARTSIAVNRRTKKTDGSYETDFFDLAAWDKTAEFMGKYLKKGSRVLVEGRIENDNYEKNGVKHYGNRIIVDNIEFGSSKKDSEPAKDDDDFSDVNEGFDADVPF